MSAARDTPSVLLGSPNQHITPEELRKIRALADFDLTMLVSEIHDHGWSVARQTLALMPEKEGE